MWHNYNGILTKPLNMNNVENLRTIMERIEITTSQQTGHMEIVMQLSPQYKMTWVDKDKGIIRITREL